MSGYLSRNLRAQKGVGYYIQNAETKKWPIKTTIQQKYSSQMKKRWTFPDELNKAEGVHHHWMCLIRNIRGSPTC